jgi:endonuclease/exonuclease/phosphatase family metal-dependent hydrolase
MKFFISALIFTISLNVLAGLKLVTYNIRNFDYDQRQRIPTDKPSLYKMIKGLNADLIGVQEIVNGQEFKNFITKYFPNYGVALTTCGGEHDQKLGFIYNKNKLQLTGFKQDLRLSKSSAGASENCQHGSRPAAIAYFYNKVDSYNLAGISVHLKSGGNAKNVTKRQYQMKVLQQIVAEIRTQKINDFVIMGDFNTTEYIFKGAVYNTFRRAIANMRLTDVAAHIQCSAYWPGRNMNDNIYEPSTLDHILVSPRIVGKRDVRKTVFANGHCAKVQCRKATAASLGVSFNGVSDHCPISADFR